MNHILLLGAGFSRNWGGFLAAEVFEYLLSIPEVTENDTLREALWAAQNSGSGFEEALSVLQRSAQLRPETGVRPLRIFNDALELMFREMNQALGRATFEFQQDRHRMVRAFLHKFSAIFTLNQDLLLEHHYLNDNIFLDTANRLLGPQIPGMQPHFVAGTRSWAEATWAPLPVADFVVTPRYHPYFKLHGSSNWRNAPGEALLIMGGNKAREIGLHPILSWYAQEFERHLQMPDTRLMIIGYGFGDGHINQAIDRAIERTGLRLFVVDPLGSAFVHKLTPVQLGAIYTPISAQEARAQKALIGASRRGLGAIFGADEVEFTKLNRFFG